MRGWFALAIVWCLSLAPAAAGTGSQEGAARGTYPVLRVPTWTKSTLANGAELIVSEKHDLPLISFSITFLGGADQFEPAGTAGRGSLTAALLERRHEDPRWRGAVERAAAARHDRQRRMSSARAGRSASCRQRRKFARRSTSWPTCCSTRHSRRRARTAPRSAARGADPGARAARRHRQPRFPANRLRSPPSLRPCGHRGVAQGDHPRRHGRVPQGVLPAGPCAR